MLAGGVGAGLIIAYVIMKMHKLLPTDANSDIILSLVTPYIIYISAEEIHSSGVLAVVSGGLFLSTHRLSFLSSTSRLRSTNVWESFSFLLNGLVFMFIGLELPEIVNGLEEVNLFTAIGYGLLVTAVLVMGRIISAYMAVVVTLIARNFITVADASNPGARVPLLLGWAGMRGVVSLAAALSIPVQLQDGSAFPHRNLILFITFIVILTTLLLQGLTLPYLIKVIHIDDPDTTKPEEELYSDLRKELAGHALKHLRDNYSDTLRAQPILQFFERKWEDTNDAHDTVLMSDDAKAVYLDILNLQRKVLHKRNSEDNINEDIIRKHLHYLDLEEEKLKML
ncbi:cation:proton antiporter [Flavobacterium rivuli]|uniref:cation:proton antiporter n=1 Tax=Flavobacterium rivuli TaxID=498301 RepID=UPI00269CCC31|nr:cation:proton antiporter [Flavobacterium rivuli]